MAKSAYELAQGKWAVENGLRKGSRVRVSRIAHDGENGWQDMWIDDMDCCVGVIGVISNDSDIMYDYGVEVEFPNGDSWYFPYFVLEPVDESNDPSYEDIANFLASCLSGTGNCPMGPDHKCPHIRGYLCLDKTKHPECWIEAVKNELKNRKGA